MGWWLKFLLILRLSQPSLAGVGAGAELGKKTEDEKIKSWTHRSKFGLTDKQIKSSL